EVLDDVPVAQWSETLWGTPAALSPGQPTDADHPVTRTRADRYPFPPDLRSSAAKGGVQAFGSRAMLRADLAPDGLLGQGLQRARRSRGGLADQPGRKVDVLDLVPLVQRTETLWRIAETPSADQSAHVHLEAAGIRANERAHAAYLWAETSQG